jgi:hypothetical protein
MVGWPETRGRSVALAVPDQKDVVDPDASARQYQVDPLIEGRRWIQQVLSLTTGVSGVGPMRRPPGVGEPGVDGGLVGGESRVR